MSQDYFNRSLLNYTLANEDTAMELAMLPEGAGHVLSVAGSGGRVLPLLARKPRLVTCVDVSQEQLYLTELRVESARVFSNAEYLAFWGYPPHAAEPDERRALFARIGLSENAKAFLSGLFESQGWKSILYLGKWERTFARLSGINRRMTGTRGAGLFSCLTLSEQEEYLRTRFPTKSWKAVIFLLGNAGIFNALLYKGHFPKKNFDGSFFRFYDRAFQHLFHQGLARENFFLQLLFFGRVVFSEGCPVECRPDVYDAVRAGLSGAEIRYANGDLLEKVEQSAEPIDFLSFSDVPSYFTGETERAFMQRIAPRIAPQGLVVVRNYIHVPENLDLAGYTTVTEEFRKAIDAERVGVYLVDIYQKSGAAR